VAQRDDRRVPHNSEKRVMKLSDILSGAVALFPLALPAHAQGVGDAQRGAQVFAQCKICHSLEAGKNMVGPSLHGLFGRKAGSVPGYAYSPAMKKPMSLGTTTRSASTWPIPKHSFRETRWCLSASRTRASWGTFSHI
jgi:cytochrome c2